MKREYATASASGMLTTTASSVAREDLLRRHPCAAHDDFVALPEFGPDLRRRRQQILLDAGYTNRDFPHHEQQHEDRQRAAALAQPGNERAAAQAANALSPRLRAAVPADPMCRTRRAR